MKTKTTFVAMLGLLFASCSLLGSPTATVKKFMAAAQKCDVDGMTQLFSKKALQQIGLDTIRSNNQSFCETLKRASTAGGPYHMENVREIPSSAQQRIAFVYKNQQGTDSISLAFDLSKESGAWKIDNIGSGDSTDAPPSTHSSSSPPVVLREPAPVPPTAPNADDKVESPSASKHAPISGGVLNGKAISLPPPPYPPIARAAKASGTVVVQVTVDENGNVISAHAVSGHPLLQAAAAAAARGAKFSPTRLNGEAVKVNGVITYNFPAP